MRSRAATRFLLDYGMIWVGILVVVIAQLLYSGFLSWSNIKVMLNENAPLGIVSIGQTFVILVGGFDLSVGAVLALCGVVYAQWANGHPLFIAVVVALAIGFGSGGLNALLVTRFKINAFIATLATGSALGGFSYITSNSLPISVSKASFGSLGTQAWFGLPIDAWAMIIIFVAAQLILSRTKFGRAIYATGGNREAARLTGLRVNMLIGSAFILAGGLAAFGGLIMASRLSLAQANFSGSLALDSIAIVVIGGTALTGGEGSIWRTAIGFIIIISINDLLIAKAVNSEWSDVVVGGVLAGAAGLDYLTRRMRERTGVRTEVRTKSEEPNPDVAPTPPELS